ncbi:MAG: GNAT family N-acetyltransferase [Elusimicrobiota bacterium]
MDIRELKKHDWDVVARLFRENGACGGCWCMWWRVEKGGRLWTRCKGAVNRSSLQRLIKQGKVHSMLAFEGEEPVGWCSFGPRESFPRLETVKALRRPFGKTTWSVVCFFIPSRYRGKGVATGLLKAATNRAFELGATEVEGYPVVPKMKPMPAAFAWTGVPALFKKCGYRELKRPGVSRPIFRAA